MVPQNYVIPSTENVPGAIRGFKLGKRVNDMRNKEAFLSDPKTQGERREWLNSLGFMYHTRNAAIHLQRSGIDGQLKLGQGLSDLWMYQVKPSLQFYFDNHGDLMVPHNYVIPSTENVPKAIRGFKLGKRVHGMRSKEAYLSDPETQGGSAENGSIP